MMKASLMLLVLSGAMPVRAQLSGAPLTSAQSFAADAGLENGFDVANCNFHRHLEFWSHNQISQLSATWIEGSCDWQRDVKSHFPRCADAPSGETSRAEQKACTSVALPPTQPSETSAAKEDPKEASAVVKAHEHPDFNRDVYYRNRLEFALDVGYLPINIPFVFDVFLGDGYNMTPLRYTLVPLVASLRWHLNDVGGPWIFRGNWDMTFSASATAIPRGPESHFFSYDMGVRRNFVPKRGKIAPYFDGRVGLGRIDAKEPLGVQFAQGQNFTFTVNMGSGARYNFNSRCSLSAGLNWMHISNLYLSQPKFANYGINVYGPLFGLDVRLGKARHHGSE
jgi:hypothetical protein